MVAPWLSWLTVFRTAAGRSERFSFFSLSCGAVCCVAACDAIAQVKIRRGTVHGAIRMSILGAVGRDSILSERTLQRAYSHPTGTLRSALHPRVELWRVLPLTITEESYEQTVNPGLCTARRRGRGVARRRLGAKLQGREVQYRRRRRHRLPDRRARHGTRVRIAQHPREGDRREHRQRDRRYSRHAAHPRDRAGAQIG